MKEELYNRTISAEESKEGYFMILKDRLSFFPMIGRAFELQSGSAAREARVESYHCECRGPDKPHDHYFVRWNDLKKGDQIVVRRDMKKPARYQLQIRSAIAQQGFCG